MANRKFRVVEGSDSKVQTASVWGATELDKGQCETLDAYAKNAKQTPAAFLGGLMLAAFLAHVAANPLPVEEQKSETAETTDAVSSETDGEVEKAEASAIAEEGGGESTEEVEEKATGTHGKQGGRRRSK